jgi:hypothetical protein
MENFSFSKWVHFDERKKLEQLEYPGIYAIAYSKKDISGEDFSYREEIVYIGMTNSQKGLRGRLSQFNTTIKGNIEKEPSHNPAGRARIALDREDKDWKRKLYVSVMSMPCNVTSNSPDDLTCMGDVAKQEYVCFAEYVKLYKKLPRFNGK